MTQKDRENCFIARCRKAFDGLTWEAEQLLRYGFAVGAEELGRAAFVEGMDAQRGQVLEALGVARKACALP